MISKRWVVALQKIEIVYICIYRSNVCARSFKSGTNKLGSTSWMSQLFASTSKLVCYVCGATHTIYKCPKFYNLTILERIKRVKDLKLCKICLRQHESKKCNARFCFKYTKAYNTLLHLSGERNPTNERGTVAQSTVENELVSEVIEESTSVSSHASIIQDDNVLLSAVIVSLSSE